MFITDDFYKIFFVNILICSHLYAILTLVAWVAVSFTEVMPGRVDQ